MSGLGSMLQVCHNVNAHSSGLDTFRVDYVREVQFLKLLGDGIGYSLGTWVLLEISIRKFSATINI